MRKVELSKIRICNMVSLNQALVEYIYSIKTFYPSVDYYVVDEKQYLLGVVSASDIEKAGLSECIKNPEAALNRNPIKIVRNRFERSMAEAVFADSAIYTIPIVDCNGILLYCYQKSNDFVERYEKELPHLSIETYEKALIGSVNGIVNKYNRWPKIVTDLDCQQGVINSEEVKNCIIDIKEIKALDKERDIVIVAYLFDYNAVEAVQECIENGIKYLPCKLEGKDTLLCVSPYFRTDVFAYNTLSNEADYNGLFFDTNDFQNIFQAIKLTSSIKGDYVEIGTYRGDSARAALLYMNYSNIKRTAYFMDTYEGFTYNEAGKSQDCMWKDTHKDTSIDLVDDRLKGLGDYHLVKGNIITDEMPKEIESIAVCNIDVDMYDAVVSSLEKVNDLISVGGVIIAEDYGHTPNLIGAQYAIRRFYEHNMNKYYGWYMQSGQFIMIRK